MMFYLFLNESTFISIQLTLSNKKIAEPFFAFGEFLEEFAKSLSDPLLYSETGSESLGTRESLFVTNKLLEAF